MNDRVAALEFGKTPNRDSRQEFQHSSPCRDAVSPILKNP
jgi:hypothetical protein